VSSTPRPENRLAKEASPYLQQHAHNPVDWYPWGPEALGRAKQEDRPILLSIGYSACHWCHVMERESFEDADIAKLMNESFVCIKVDREERPDLDQIYQLVVQLMGRNGGWPLTVFLTPDQKPFFGGTYFPPKDRYGMPGFPAILHAVGGAYRDKREDVNLQARELADAIGRVTQLEMRGTAHYEPGPDLLERAASKLGTRFDDEHGGFGTRPKFPNTMGLEVLLRRGALEGDARALGRAKGALTAMRAGGVYDQLGGGFHRYSTDDAWLVPHFEKMLYDNALLLRLYVDGHRATGEARHAETAREIASYVRREMTHPDGGFYATQDADSEGEEGKFFVWSPDEVAGALGDAELAKLVCARFGITDDGNFEHTGKSVLHESNRKADLAVKLGRAPSEVEASLRDARARLFAVREGRIKPFRDEKILASWNGLMIGALAEAGAALGESELVAMAERAFAFVDRTLCRDGRVLRHVKDGVIKGPGFLDDHAFVANAALDLYEATGKAEYVATARSVVDAMLTHFWDAAQGGLYFTPDDGEALISRTKDPFDHAIPSGMSIATTALLRLGALVDAKYTEPAVKELERIAPTAVDNPFGLGQSVCALDRLVRGSIDIVLVGRRDDPRTGALASAVFRAYLPNRTLAWLDPTDAASRAACVALAEGKPPKEAPVAYVCRGRTCSLPVATPEELRPLLQ
jgi:uncharacterized protein YyaL (SSP411 family)